MRSDVPRNVVIYTDTKHGRLPQHELDIICFVKKNASDYDLAQDPNSEIGEPVHCVSHNLWLFQNKTLISRIEYTRLSAYILKLLRIIQPDSVYIKPWSLHVAELAFL